MIDVKYIRENKKEVENGIKAKGFKVDIDSVLELDGKRGVLRKQIEELNAERKKNAETKNIETGKKIKEKIAKLENDEKILDEKIYDILRKLPNLPLPEVPVGKDEIENVVLREVGEKPKFNFPADILPLSKTLEKNHLEADAFQVFAGGLELIRAGYLDYNEDEMYHLEKDDLYLIGTSEQAIAAMHMNEILEAKKLPLRYAGFSSCFRREAGSYGKDTKGILRVHQFDKIEMFSFFEPENSKKEHEFLLSMEEKLMQALQIPYRVLQMCTGDLGFQAANKYDIEAWLPGQNQYRETHSTSNDTEFQSRRLNIKYKNLKTGKNEFVHTLNGTAFAIGRMIIAIMENYQQKDGVVKIPTVLEGYIK
ncbi:MAG: Serine-tRNA ligase [Candidatus Azambacteria bacterium GW2011_GWA2_39_10]|uniref:Serine--tRNA ligase n=1 Tax=Candidatus Azambacteria bacterium GW2011_GWA2_39_10 TaxID=1618611 RepID=A0A0G0PTF4_9BACT|nr:MAG: Serine-tRNA ligase [Candidatus Azambacteria bacterium GW2011_GWA2_39_10]